MAAPDADLSPRTWRASVLGLLVLHLAMLSALAARLPWTRDEYPYLKAGALLRLERSWEVPHTTFHGPLPYLANQIPAWLGIAPVEPADAYLFWGRVGMLPFAAITAVALLLLVRRMFDKKTALLALVLHASNPVVLTNAPLMTTDMAMTAMCLLAVAVAYDLARDPRPWRWLALAVVLGASLATKYLALFFVPVLALWLATSLWRRNRGVLRPGAAASASRRTWQLLVAALGVAVVAWLTLHTCYLWAAPFYDPTAAGDGAPRSAALRRVLTLPLLPWLLRLLPEPFVRGVDFQKMQSDGAGLTPFCDELAAGHAGYFVVSLATKLPLAWLALVALGLVRGAPWPRHARALLVAGIGLPIAYLSLCSVLQNGIRNVLPSVVLLTIVAARGAAWLLPTRTKRMALAVALAALAACHALTWPRYPSAFNILAGSRPYLIFADANFDWSIRTIADEQAMRASYPAAVRANMTTGPAFGTFLLNGVELARADPRAPSKLYHWLRRFHPHARLGAFYVFVVDAAAFAAADDADAPRSRAELATAMLGAGDAQGARALVAGVGDEDAARVHAVATGMLAGAPSDSVRCQLLLELGRADLVARADSMATPFQRASAHYALGEMAAARATLEAAAATRRLTPPEVNLLVGILATVQQPDAALALLDQYAPPLDAPERALFDSLRRSLVESERVWRRLIER